MQTMRQWMVLGLVSALAAGCSGHRLAGYAPEDEGCATVFRIDNQGPEAVEVFMHRGVPVRLGTVPAWRSVRVTSRHASLQGMKLRLIARPLAGGRAVATEELLPGAGDQVRWTIMQPIDYSAISAVIERPGAARNAGKCRRGGPRRG